MCTRILVLLGHAERRLNFPHDASATCVRASTALASSKLPLSLDELRAALGPSSTEARTKRMALFRSFLRSIDIPGRILKPKLSAYRGVSPSRGGRGWRARILVDGKIRALGAFRSESEAARAYDAAVRAEHEAKRAAGLRARKLILNFPDEGSVSFPKEGAAV